MRRFLRSGLGLRSGETADSLESVRMAKKDGVPVIGLVNTVGSTIARESDAGVPIYRFGRGILILHREE